MGINVDVTPNTDTNDKHDNHEIAGKENISTSSNSSNGIISLNEEELKILKQCRNRAYSQVNKKKRMHQCASLSQHIQKEWTTIYPNSSLSGKKLLELFESNACSEVVNNEALACDPPQKSKRGRKRKLPEPVLEQNIPPVVIKKSKSREFEVYNNVMDNVVSESTHEDRQWTDAMLKNLMYCNVRAVLQRKIFLRAPYWIYTNGQNGCCLA